jgi:hypothetical protein
LPLGVGIPEGLEVTIGPTAVEDTAVSSGVSLPVGYSLGVSSGAAVVSAVVTAVVTAVVSVGTSLVGFGVSLVGSALVDTGVEEVGSSGAAVEDGVLPPVCGGGTSSCLPDLGVVSRPHPEPAELREFP